MEFKTDQFIVRKLKTEDLRPYFEMVSNEKVMLFIKPPLNYAESIAELKSLISYYKLQEKCYYIWAIIDISNKDFLGICGVYKNEHQEHEIAYRLLEKFWGRGYGYLIAEALLDHCFGTLELKEAVAYIHRNNNGSIRIISKLKDTYLIDKSLKGDEIKFVIKRA